MLSEIYSRAQTNRTCIKSFRQATGGFARFPPPFPTDLVCGWLNHLEQRQLPNKTLQGVMKEIFKEANQTQVPVLEFLIGHHNHLTLSRMEDRAKNKISGYLASTLYDRPFPGFTTKQSLRVEDVLIPPMFPPFLLASHCPLSYHIHYHIHYHFFHFSVFPFLHLFKRLSKNSRKQQLNEISFKVSPLQLSKLCTSKNANANVSANT